MLNITKMVIALGLMAGVCATALAQEVTYRKDIRPLWQDKCSGCHGPSAPYLGEFMENEKKFTQQLKGPRMDTYADLIFFVGWPDTGAIMRRLNDGAKGGKPGNMYQYLGASEEERQKNLKLFKDWIGPGAWIQKRWKARGEVPGVTKEELDAMRVKY
ncbi:MAG: cytochrome C [Betaproteobacteria bacterium]|nr:cytochrome C [Betaproteobacteria bacterium]